MSKSAEKLSLHAVPHIHRQATESVPVAEQLHNGIVLLRLQDLAQYTRDSDATLMLSSRIAGSTDCSECTTNIV